MTVVLKLYDGTTTLNLNDLTNYALPTDEAGTPLWAPTVPMLSESPLSGRGPYEDTIEEIEVHVRGSTGANALAAYAALASMMETALRAQKGEGGIAPVQLQYRPHNSSLGADVKAVVLGRVGMDQMISAPPDLNRADNKEISGVRLRFWVRWKWIGADDTWSTSSATDIGTVVTLTDVSNPPQSTSPCKLNISGFNPSTTPSLTAGVLFVGIGPFAQAAESMTASKYTSVSDTTNKAKSGSVLRYTPTDTAFNLSGASTTYNGTARHWLVYATVRNNSGSATWRIRLAQTALGKLTYAPEVPIDASSTNPRIVCLGVLAGMEQSTQQFTFKLDIAASTTSGSPTLDIDTLYVLPVHNDEVSKVIQFEAIDLVGAFSASSTSVSLVFDDRVLTSLTPAVYALKVSNGDKVDTGYKTDPIIFTEGGAMMLCLVMTGGNSAAHWVFTNSSGTVVQVQYQLVLHNAYISPP